MENKTEKEAMATVFLPIDRENKAPLFVSVNDRTWLIERGKEVKVPCCVKEILDFSAASDLDAMNYEQKLSGGNA